MCALFFPSQAAVGRKLQTGIPGPFDILRLPCHTAGTLYGVQQKHADSCS
jgi:hypothetical protein